MSEYIEGNKIRAIVKMFLDKPEEDGWNIRYMEYRGLIISEEIELSDEERKELLHMLKVLAFGMPQNNEARPITYDVYNGPFTVRGKSYFPGGN